MPTQTSHEKGLKRFGQGSSVDRNRPHIFHRDYLILKTLRDAAADFLNRHEEELKGKTLLDFGAGDSPYARMFIERGVRFLQADIGSDNPDVLAISADGRVPLEDGSVDVVLSTQVLEHVADVPKYLAEAMRLLKPGGWLVLTTHGAFIRHGHPSDFWRWMLDGLDLQLRLGGFEDVEIVPRIGILATATHLRAITLGALTRKVPGTGWLRPIIYLFANLRMMLEECITPASVMDSFPELLLATARKSLNPQ